MPGTADKFSVDSRKPRFELLYQQTAGVTSNGILYAPWGVIGNVNGTESIRDAQAHFNGVLRKLTSFILTNGKDGVTVVGMRVNGVTAASISVAAGATQEQNSADLNVYIASTDLINVIEDTSASTNGGTFTIASIRALIDFVS